MIREEKTFQIPSAMQIGKTPGCRPSTTRCGRCSGRPHRHRRRGRLPRRVRRRSSRRSFRWARSPGWRRSRSPPPPWRGSHERGPSASAKIDRFLRLMTSRGASDFHLTGGPSPDAARVGIDGADPLTARLAGGFRRAGATDRPGAAVGRVHGDGRRRPRLRIWRGSRASASTCSTSRRLRGVFRIIPSTIMTLEQLGMPDQVRKLAAMESGLVLVTGPTGSGKSTTLAAVINLINETENYHVTRSKVPIEFVHPNKRCLIHQREIGSHATSFSEALKAAGREDPDLILVGEIADLRRSSRRSPRPRRARSCSELHTNNAAKTCDRIISVFPSGERGGDQGRARRDPARGGGAAASSPSSAAGAWPRSSTVLARDRQHDPRRQDAADHLRDPDGREGRHDRVMDSSIRSSTTRRR